MRSISDSAYIVLAPQGLHLKCYVNGERFVSHQEELCNGILDICRIKVKPVANTALRFYESVL